MSHSIYRQSAHALATLCALAALVLFASGIAYAEGAAKGAGKEVAKEPVKEPSKEAATDYAKRLREKGNTYCSKVINKAANWLIGQDAATYSVLNDERPSEHSGIVIAAKRYADGNSVVHVNALPTARKGCDVTFTQVVPLEQSCANLRQSVFKGWTYLGTIQTLPLLSDPTSPDVIVLLQPVGTNCVMTKTGTLFYELEDLQ